MLLKTPKRDEKNLCLKGAVQINHSSFFVYEDSSGRRFLDTGEDETHYEEYYESGKVNIIFNYENIQGTALNGYRRSYCPGIYGIPELIGSYGSLIFYKIGNTVNYL